MFIHTDKQMTLVADIGGSHVSAGLVGHDGVILKESFFSRKIDTAGTANEILTQWLGVMNTALSKKEQHEVSGIGIAMPGPFDYEHGICLMNGVSKYHHLYGVNIKEVLKNHLNVHSDVPIFFSNDASCFGLGEASSHSAACKRIIAITLGTGFGAAFFNNGMVAAEGDGIPANGYLYDVPFKDGIAEDYISSRWISQRYREAVGKEASVKDIAREANRGNGLALEIFRIFGTNLADCLLPWVKSFSCDCILIGGSISKSSNLFLPCMREIFSDQGIPVAVSVSEQLEFSALVGAAKFANNLNKKKDNGSENASVWRKTSQPLIPVEAERITNRTGEYNIYPYFSIGDSKIYSGYDSLARWIISYKTVIIDGYIGNDWHAIRNKLSKEFKDLSVTTLWFESSAFFKPESEIDEMVKPFLGEEDAVWGKKTDLFIEDFFQCERIQSIKPDSSYDINIFIGNGAALSEWDAPIIYIDLPKNEIQYRMRAGSAVNLGKAKAQDSFQMYKRFYFVDWPVMNKHRKEIKNRIAAVADGQWKSEINWTFYDSLNAGLQALSKGIIRVRPWFEAGTWGGQWLKQHISSLSKEEINYAWSFELIVPENGLIFESSGNLLEVAFDWIMEIASENVLGRDAERFGDEFPIRFNFLDTFDGGNLSVQCHPSLNYIREEFGEHITQDETYYILDCKENSGVYLGFQDGIDPIDFKNRLKESVEESVPIKIENYVQFHPARKHDLFLIPNRTIHSSGANNLVLEISSTPYIFTFKMYDWLRLDLNGEPRPINIEHAFKNLNFDRKGERVKSELLSRPELLDEDEKFRLIHLPTHPEHFYDVHRIEFLGEISIATNDQCHILMLVEGTTIEAIIESGYKQIFSYAETIIIPAVVKSYTLRAKGDKMSKVIKAFIK